MQEAATVHAHVGIVAGESSPLAAMGTVGAVTRKVWKRLGYKKPALFQGTGGRDIGGQANLLGNRYTLLQHLASGGMADAYLARDNYLQRRVVVKRIKPSLDGQASFTDMLIDEARTMAALNHRNIVRIYDMGYQEDTPFLAMEWLEGWELRAIFQSARGQGQPIDLAVAIRIVIDTCRGLHQAHEASSYDGGPLCVVHRDITPHNLFVTTDGILKILDFGIAKSAIQQSETRKGELKGKFAYMSPEQVDGRPLDRRSDIFSLGVILHELLSGARLFGSLSAYDCLNAVVSAPIAPPARAGEILPEALVRSNMRALERAPKLRFATADAFGDALEEVARQVGKAAEEADVAAYLATLYAQSGPSDRRAPPVWRRPPTAPVGALDIGELGRRSVVAVSQSRSLLVQSWRPLRRRWWRWLVGALGMVGLAVTLALCTASESPPKPPQVAAGADANILAAGRDPAPPAKPMPSPPEPVIAAPRPSMSRVRGKGRLARVDLRWSPVVGARGYHVQLSQSPDFSSVDLDFRVRQPWLSRRRVRRAYYYWRVRAQVVGGYGPFGRVGTLDALKRRGLWRGGGKERRKRAIVSR